MIEKKTNKKKSEKRLRENPTSPHLQIYKWNISSITSILHRLTGVALYFSVLIVSWYVVYYAYQIDINESSESCDCAMSAILKNLFSLAAIAITFSLYYHFCNGIRHLFWDIGKGFERKVAVRNGYIVVCLATLFTIATVGAVAYLKFF